MAKQKLTASARIAAHIPNKALMNLPEIRKKRGGLGIAAPLGLSPKAAKTGINRLLTISPAKIAREGESPCRSPIYRSSAC